MELISPVATSFHVLGFIKLPARRNEKNGRIQFMRSIIAPNFRYIESGKRESVGHYKKRQKNRRTEADQVATDKIWGRGDRVRRANQK